MSIADATPPFFLESWRALEPRGSLFSSTRCLGAGPAELSGFHVIDKAGDRNVLWNYWMAFDFLDLVFDVLFKTRKGVELHDACLSSELFLKSSLKLLVRELQHGTVSMFNYQKLLCAEEFIGHHERTNDIICYDTPGVSDDTSYSFKSRYVISVYPRVHASKDG